MYRHLLVPLDDTDLSIEVVGNAVGLAHAVGARITFFHAVAGDSRAKAGELLAKAEAAARACGVPCDSRQAPGDRPAEVIVETARGIGCDLVFMASHGHHRGCSAMPAPASQTMGVVFNAGLPVLVSGVGDPQPLAHAIGIIRDAHRSLAAAIHALQRALATARSAGEAADARQMRTLVRYIETFSLALHDLKEESLLFERLRERTASLNAELDEIERRHLRERERVADLSRRIDALASTFGESAVFATRELEEAVRNHAALLWERLGREEGVILPATRRDLTEADWSEIDAVFVRGRAALGGSKAESDAVRSVLCIAGTTQA